MAVSVPFLKSMNNNNIIAFAPEKHNEIFEPTPHKLCPAEGFCPFYGMPNSKNTAHWLRRWAVLYCQADLREAYSHDSHMQNDYL